jgi:threonine dehydrogenase-like Zn-dependent dehydrogenase
MPSRLHIGWTNWPVIGSTATEMKQISLNAPGELVERDVQPAYPSAGEALVRMKRVGVCGSDFHALAGRHPIYTYPRVLGHELSGEIVEIAPNKRGLQVGDLCAIEPYIYCGTCRACNKGRTNCCEHLRVYGVHVDGGMQGYLPVRIDLLHPSKVLSLDQLALIETLGIGAHAVERSALRDGEHALVMGAGPIGLGVAQFALLAGATVSVVEYNPVRRRFVEMMGARALGQPDSQVYDVVFDATGSVEAMNKSLDYVAATGRLVYVGLTKESLIINDSLFHRREMTVMASRNSCNQFPRIIRIIEEGKIEVNPWITDRMALSDVPIRLKELPTKSTLVKALVELDEADV